MSSIDLKKFETLSPFEIKDELIVLAKDPIGLPECRPRESKLDRNDSA